MRFIGLLLLIAVIVVGFRQFTAPPPAPVIVSVPAAPRGQEAPAIQPGSEPARRGDVAPAAAMAGEDCYAPKHDYNTSVPSSLVVAPGHLVVASFFRPGEPEQVSVLTAGTWRNDAGWTFGVTFDYPNCPLPRVISEAQAHAGRRGGAFLGVGQGFTGP